jgi:hypothetical protein
MQTTTNPLKIFAPLREIMRAMILRSATDLAHAWQHARQEEKEGKKICV